MMKQGSEQVNGAEWWHSVGSNENATSLQMEVGKEHGLGEEAQLTRRDVAAPDHGNQFRRPMRLSKGGQKDEEKQALERREQAFNIFLSGANLGRVRDQQLRENQQRASSRDGNGAVQQPRKNWQKAPEIRIKASDGTERPLVNPTMKLNNGNTTGSDEAGKLAQSPGAANGPSVPHQMLYELERNGVEEGPRDVLRDADTGSRNASNGQAANEVGDGGQLGNELSSDDDDYGDESFEEDEEEDSSKVAAAGGAATSVEPGTAKTLTGESELQQVATVLSDGEPEVTSHMASKRAEDGRETEKKQHQKPGGVRHQSGVAVSRHDVEVLHHSLMELQVDVEHDQSSQVEPMTMPMPSVPEVLSDIEAEPESAPRDDAVGVGSSEVVICRSERSPLQEFVAKPTVNRRRSSSARGGLGFRPQNTTKPDRRPPGPSDGALVVLGGDKPRGGRISRPLSAVLPATTTQSNNSESSYDGGYSPWNKAQANGTTGGGGHPYPSWQNGSCSLPTTSVANGRKVRAASEVKGSVVVNSAAECSSSDSGSREADSIKQPAGRGEKPAPAVEKDKGTRSNAVTENGRGETGRADQSSSSPEKSSGDHQGGHQDLAGSSDVRRPAEKFPEDTAAALIERQDSWGEKEMEILVTLSKKVRLLDSRKQKYLMKVLEKLEQAQLDKSLDLASLFSAITSPRDEGVKGWKGPQVEEERAYTSTTSKVVDPPPEPMPGLRLRILSNWGHRTFAGLTEVDVFDIDGRAVTIPAESVSVSGGVILPAYTQAHVGRLVNGHVRTFDPNYMWTAPVPPAGARPLEIAFSLPENTPPLGHLEVWNYNSSLEETRRGVREVQVYLDGALVWQGHVNKALANEEFDDYTTINIAACEASATNSLHQSRATTPPNSTTFSGAFATSSSSSPAGGICASTWAGNNGRAKALRVPAPPPLQLSARSALSDPSTSSLSPSPAAPQASPLENDSMRPGKRMETGPSAQPGMEGSSSTAAKVARAILHRRSDDGDAWRRESVADSPEESTTSSAATPIWLQGEVKPFRDPVLAESLDSLTSTGTSPRSTSSRPQRPRRAVSGRRAAGPPPLKDGGSTADSPVAEGQDKKSTGSRSVARLFRPSKSNKPLPLVDDSDPGVPEFDVFGASSQSQSTQSPARGGALTSVALEEGTKSTAAAPAQSSSQSRVTKSRDEERPVEQKRSKSLLRDDAGNGNQRMATTEREGKREGKSADKMQDLKEALEAAVKRSFSARLTSDPAQDRWPEEHEGSSSSTQTPCKAPGKGKEEAMKVREVADLARESSSNTCSRTVVGARGESGASSGVSRVVSARQQGHLATSRIDDDEWDSLEQFKLSQFRRNKDRGKGVSVADPPPPATKSSNNTREQPLEEADVPRAPPNEYFQDSLDNMLGETLLRQYEAQAAARVREREARESEAARVAREEAREARAAREAEDRRELAELGAEILEMNEFSSPRAESEERQGAGLERSRPSVPASLFLGDSLSEKHQLLLASSDLASSHLEGQAGAAAASSISHAVEEGAEVKPFEIPDLPIGQELLFTALTTWGDPYYIGLAGIDVFDARGQLLTLDDPKSQIWLGSPDHSVFLPPTGDYPHTVENLVDQSNFTRDDTHAWIAPYTPGQPHHIRISLDRQTTLGAIRIWNYNRSRIYAVRGVREMEIQIDRKVIFRGEIRIAPGLLVGPHVNAETILFTQSEEFLAAIDVHDNAYRGHEPSLAVLRTSAKRPKTGGRRSLGNGSGSSSTTTAAGKTNGMIPALPSKILSTSMELPPAATVRPSTSSVPPPESSVGPSFKTSNGSSPSSGSPGAAPSQFRGFLPGKKLVLELMETWGDPHFVGLTGIEVIDVYGNQCPFTVADMRAFPRDINCIPEITGDPRTLDKLIDGFNLTTNHEHMWTVPLVLSKEKPWLSITFKREHLILGIRVWNYNRSPEDSFRGVRRMRVFIDDEKVSPPGGFYIRKASGVLSTFDYGQLIMFDKYSGLEIQRLQMAFSLAVEKARKLKPLTRFIRQDCTTPLLPSGSVITFFFHETWGDEYYLGLNGLELYNEDGALIPLTTGNLYAMPDSINDVDPSGDPRTVDKLIDGVNNTWDDHHMWLTPYDLEQERPNSLRITILSQPIMISMIKIWNYSKTPARGVKLLTIFMDDRIIYEGGVRPAPSRPLEEDSPCPNFCHAILFSNDESLIRANKEFVYQSQVLPQTVGLYDNNRRQNDVQPLIHNPKAANSRPPTSVAGGRS